MMTYRIGIIGYPLQHSISPAFQQAAFLHRNIDAIYESWETPAESLKGLLAWLRETPEAWGANVTVPHKETVFEAVDQVDPTAAAVGAVNTVVARDGRLTGYNTDVGGFLRALTHDARLDLAEARVLLLGAGGAARAVVVALAQAGVAHVTVANRTLARAETVADLANSYGLSVQSIPLNDLALLDTGGAWDLIVNATSIGMRSSVAENESPMAASLIPSGALVYDLVYNPPITPLLEAALAAGARTLSGLSMLVYQGAESFTLWTKMDAPIEEMMTAARQALEGA